MGEEGKETGKLYVHAEEIPFPVVSVYVKVLVYIIFKVQAMTKQPASESPYSTSFMSWQHKATSPCES